MPINSLAPIAIEQPSEEDIVIEYAKYIQEQYFGGRGCILKIQVENRRYTFNTRTNQLKRESFLQSYKKWLKGFLN